jgi:hypothetical protein
MKTIKESLFLSLFLTLGALTSFTLLHGAAEESKEDELVFVELTPKEIEWLRKGNPSVSEEDGLDWMLEQHETSFDSSERPFRKALLSASFELAKEIIDGGSIDSDTCLAVATEYLQYYGFDPVNHSCFYARLIELLLDKGADPSGFSQDYGTPFQAVVNAAWRLQQDSTVFGGCAKQQEECEQMYSLLVKKMSEKMKEQGVLQEDPEGWKKDLELTFDTNPEEFWDKVRDLEQNEDEVRLQVQHGIQGNAQGDGVDDGQRPSVCESCVI